MSWRLPLPRDVLSTALLGQLPVGRPLDLLYAHLGVLGTGKFFPQGWGDLKAIDYDEDLKCALDLPSTPLPISWRQVDAGSAYGADYKIYEGQFPTPCTHRVVRGLPRESRAAHAQLVVPKATSGRADSFIVQLAATGDHGFARRQNMAFPLLRHVSSARAV